MKTAFLYHDLGVDKELFSSLLVQLKRKFRCECITAREIIEGSLLERADLFVIPGGRDLPYVKLLHGAGIEKIRMYVEKGGCFLGICAGAYFASSYVEFDKGGPLHVEGARELQFFPGKSIGPLFGPYYYDSEKGAKIVSLSYQHAQEHFLSRSYYNGGCFFEKTPSHLYETLATYENDLPAIVLCKVGNGIAILSGVHFEKSVKDPVAERERVRLMAAVMQHFERKRKQL